MDLNRNGGKSRQKNRIKKRNHKYQYSKEAQAKKLDIQIAKHRECISHLNMETVVAAGTLMRISRDSTKPVMLTDVRVNGEYLDHLWIKLNIIERRKLRLCPWGTRIYFTGLVHSYSNHYNDHMAKLKYGITDVKLFDVDMHKEHPVSYKLTSL